MGAPTGEDCTAGGAESDFQNSYHFFCVGAGGEDSICNLPSFILAGAQSAVAILVRSARRLLSEPHLSTLRLFAV